MVFNDNEQFNQKANIKVVGVGLGGRRTIKKMVENDVRGGEFIAVNTDAQDLQRSLADKRIQIGRKLTRGLGAGQMPEVGKKACLESEEEVKNVLKGADMVFVTCGMGGGTGTGAAPVVARIAKELGALTIAIVTRPFQLEGPKRLKNALEGIDNIRPFVDTLIVIPNDRLLVISDRNTKLLDAFREADKILRYGVQGIAELVAIPGQINLDFADVKTVMKDAGTALMGIGIASGPDRAIAAARKAIHSRILEISIEGASKAIVSIASSDDITMFEVEEIMEEIRNATSKDIEIIFGIITNLDLKDELVVTIVATGIEFKSNVNTAEKFSDEVVKRFSQKIDSAPGQVSNDERNSVTSKLPGWLKKK